MNRSEFEELKRLTELFKYGFRHICKKNNHSCDDCDFMHACDGWQRVCMIDEFSEALANIKGFNKDGTILHSGDFKLTAKGLQYVNSAIKSFREEQRMLLREGQRKCDSILDKDDYSIIREIEKELYYKMQNCVQHVRLMYEIVDGFNLCIDLENNVDFIKIQ